MLLQVFINTELYARVSVAALFHQLKSLGTEEALQSGKLFLLKLLDSAVTFSDSEQFIYWFRVCQLSQCCPGFLYAVTLFLLDK
jgi:hypothetical protein